MHSTIAQGVVSSPVRSVDEGSADLERVEGKRLR
jgi:hypothetical protein